MGRVEFLSSLEGQHQLRAGTVLNSTHYDSDLNEIDEPQRYAAVLSTHALGAEADGLLTVSDLKTLFGLFLFDTRILGSYPLAELEAVWDLDEGKRVKATIFIRVKRETIETKSI